MRRFFASLFGQVVAALVLGVVIGVVRPDLAVALKPLGDGFIKLIKMAIAPLVFGVVVHGIVGAGDLRKVGRVGLKALIYFEAVTTLALVLGLQGKFSDAEAVSRQDLSPEEAAANTAALRAFVAQPNSWKALKAADARGARPVRQVAERPAE